MVYLKKSLPTNTGGKESILSSLRNFGISFIISLAVLALLAYYALGVAASLFDPEKKVAAEGQKQEVQIFEGDDVGGNVDKGIRSGRSFNILVIGTDRDDEIYDYTEPSTDKLSVKKRVKATTLLFVRFDKDNRALRFCFVPSSTVVDVDFVRMDLGTAYDYKGAEFVKDKVSGLLGMSIDYYFEFSGRDFVTYCPRTAYTAPVSLEIPPYKGLQGGSFTEGQLLAGASFYTYLHYDDFPLDKIDLRSTLVREIFLQTAVKLATYNARTYFDGISSFKTNMPYSDVAELIEVLYTLPLFVGQSEDETTVTVIDLYKMGVYAADGSFTPDKDAVRATMEKYK